MTTEIDRLLVRVEANAVQFENSIKKLNRSMYGSQAEMRKSLDRMKRDFEQRSAGIVRPLGEALRTEVAGMATVLAGAFSTAQVVAYADAWTEGRNALAAAGVATGDLASRQGELVNLANETRTSTENTIALYRRLTIASQELGLADAEVLRLTELLNKAFQAGGASTQEAASAALQLSQALASGVLQGDELRAIRESAPLVAMAIADSMGVSIGALKELGAEGKLTGRIVADAILGAADDIESRFGATTVTVGQALQILNNELGRYVGQADQGLSASQKMAQAIVSLATNLDRIIPVLTTLATIIGIGYASSLTVAGVRTAAATVETIRYQVALAGLTARQTGATTAQVLLNGAMAANPIGLVVTVVAALAAGLFILAQRYDRSRIAAEELASVTETGNEALRRYEEALRQAESASGASAAAARRNAEALREEAAAAIVAARALAAKRTAEAQEALTIASRAFQEATATTPRDAGEVAGQLAFAAGSQRRFEQAQADAAAAIREQIRMEQELGRIRQGSAISAPVGNGAAPSGGTAPAGGQVRDNSAEIAARRVILDLEMQAQLLRARGREADADALDRRLEIMRLTERLEAAGVEDAEARATAYVDAMQAAERTRAALDAIGEALNEQAEAAREAVRLATEAQEAADREALARYENARDEFRYEFVNGIRAAIDGDLGRAFEGLADRFTNRLLEQAADGLFDVIFGGRGGGKGGGGNLLSSVFSSLFGGGRAMGGPVKAGMIYRVNENTPNSEFFAPGVDGSIIPRLKGMSIPQGGGRQVIEHRITVTPERDSFIRLSADTATPIAAQAGQVAFGGARQAVPADLARRDAYRRG